MTNRHNAPKLSLKVFVSRCVNYLFSFSGDWKFWQTLYLSTFLWLLFLSIFYLWRFVNHYQNNYYIMFTNYYLMYKRCMSQLPESCIHNFYCEKVVHGKISESNCEIQIFQLYNDHYQIPN